MRQADHYQVVEFSFSEPVVPGTSADRGPGASSLYDQDSRAAALANPLHQAGRKKRLEHASCSRAVIGISSGLDSHSAAGDGAPSMLGLPREQICCIDHALRQHLDRTYSNACTMTKRVGASLPGDQHPPLRDQPVFGGH